MCAYQCDSKFFLFLSFVDIHVYRRYMKNRGVYFMTSTSEYCLYIGTCVYSTNLTKYGSTYILMQYMYTNSNRKVN